MVVALVVNLGVALAKLVAAIVTRSTAMSAEAAHALAGPCRLWVLARVDVVPIGST